VVVAGALGSGEDGGWPGNSEATSSSSRLRVVRPASTPRTRVNRSWWLIQMAEMFRNAAT
jgi:hypothetical protein